jgi:hypothetical protein
MEELMDKKIAGLLGAAVALGTLGTAQAAPAPATTDVLAANSFADLLQPIPNAVALLQAVDESAPAASTDGNIQLAQYHHHHHHHHHGLRRIIPRVLFGPRHRHHHHHHHHHHHGYYR